LKHPLAPFAGQWLLSAAATCTLLFSTVTDLSAKPFIQACGDEGVRHHCGAWVFGGYYSVSPEGDWFAGISGGAEYYVLPDASLGVSLSPGFGEGYFYLAPSLEVNYYLWHNRRWELIAGYSFRYFYDWPFKKEQSESDGSFHGPGVTILYGLTDQIYAGTNVSYQWIRFSGENYQDWYFTLPVFYAL